MATTRGSVLSTKEIKVFWEKLETATMHTGLRFDLKLLLISGQRREELAQRSFSFGLALSSKALSGYPSPYEEVSIEASNAITSYVYSFTVRNNSRIQVE